MSSPTADVTTLRPFEEQDLSLANAALSLIPELQLATHLLREAKTLGLSYPITTVSELYPFIPQGSLHAVGHIVNADEVDRFFPEAYLPITGDDDFLRKVYMTLQRCKLEASTAVNRRNKA